MMVLENTPFNIRHVRIEVKIYLGQIGDSILKSREMFSRQPLREIVENRLKTMAKILESFCHISMTSTHSDMFYLPQELVSYRNNGLPASHHEKIDVSTGKFSIISIFAAISALDELLG